MIKAYINILVMLFLSWAVYGYCQEDKILPVLVAALAVLTLLLRGFGAKSADKEYKIFEKIPLSVVIVVSLLGGIFWRNFVPIPRLAQSPFPEFTAALQSGSVIAAIFIWLAPLTKENMYRLVFCAWLTVALSINVPFTANMLIVFSSFCFVSISIAILYTRNRPTDKKYFFVYARDFIFYSAVLIMLTTGLFIIFSRTIVAVESAFFNTVSDYILPRNYTHFLRISSQLNLITPGTSSFDRRPVMEVSLPKDIGNYLKMQVFADYKNGTWNEPKEVKKTILPSIASSSQPLGKIVMFTYFKDLIPAPEEIDAVKSKALYLHSEDRIVYAKQDQNMRILEFSVSQAKKAVELSPDEYARYTALPSGISTELKQISDSIVDKKDDVRTKANKLAQYLRNNFVYSLDVDFSADDKGLMTMLREKRPAYCTYFASALALLLRSQAIPARIAAGFLTTEVVDPKNNTHLVRVNNAHAWTEVYAPMVDFSAGKTIMLWRRLDATPTSYSDELAKKSGRFNLEVLFEKMWLGSLRFSAQIVSMDKDQFKLYVILGLLGIMVFINQQKIILAVTLWFKEKSRPGKVRYESLNSLRIIYSRYETYLKKEFGQIRHLADTDADVIFRLKEQFPEKITSIERMEEFVREFHAVRFGAKSAQQLSVWFLHFKR